MLSLIKLPQKLIKSFCVLRNQKLKPLNGVRTLGLCRNSSSQVRLYGNKQSRGLLVSSVQYRVIISREKSRAKKAGPGRREQEDDSDDDDDDEDDEEYVEDGALVKTYSLPSMRIDYILKQVLNLKRKKIEESFYSNKIRVNGRVIFKKSENASVGDEVDIIKGVSKSNPGLIEVGRVEILKVKRDDADEERILVRIKKYKSLTISNYEGGDAWKEPEPEAPAEA